MTPRHHKLFYGSSYDRGSDYLLFMWSDIKKEYPDAELHFAYGWELFDKLRGNNQERMDWKNSVQQLMKQDGVFEHGRLGKGQLAQLRKSCGIWSYPTDFPEINCITALDAQSDGLVPVVTNYAALQETVMVGIKVDGDIKDIKVMEKYKQELIDLMGDKDRWELLSKNAKKATKDYRWDKIASKWIGEFAKPVKQPKVSIITPTIRTGFWNIMANNIANQTYKNLEWIIVDDAKEDRKDIADEYAKKYNLNIKYLRGERKVKRFYGLVSANNTAWKQAEGELLVWLQDFILLPQDGIERLVDVYRHNPDALIAPTDVYYHTSVKPDLSNKRDWFAGNLDVVGKFWWENIRNKRMGLRETMNATDFEMNYGAIPRKIVEALNGWWEFMDDGLGFDNSDIAFRALQCKFRLLIDDTNVATCLDLWEHIEGTDENCKDREHRLNNPRFFWMQRRMKDGSLPIVRDEDLDDKITFLQYKIDPSLNKQEAADWILENGYQIVEEWEAKCPKL